MRMIRISDLRDVLLLLFSYSFPAKNKNKKKRNKKKPKNKNKSKKPTAQHHLIFSFCTAVKWFCGLPISVESSFSCVFFSPCSCFFRISGGLPRDKDGIVIITLTTMSPKKMNVKSIKRNCCLRC